MGLVKTYEQLLALRFCLGIFEAGLFPGLNLYLTGWYRREEINRRASVFFAGAVLAGAFGGIFGCAYLFPTRARHYMIDSVPLHDHGANVQSH